MKDFAVASPLGNDPAAFERALFAGTPGVHAFAGPSPGFPVRAVGKIPGFERTPLQSQIVPLLLRQFPRGLGRIDGIAGFLTRPTESDLHDLGLSLATAPAELLHARAQTDWLLAQLAPFAESLPTARDCLWISEACVTGATALGIAMQRIRLGRWKRALVICSELRASPVDILRFHFLGTLSTRPVPAEEASCPFSTERDGFIPADGAAAVILEAAGDGDCDGDGLAEVAGYAQTSDAFRLTEGRPDAAGPVAAMRGALASAGIEPAQIGCISAHGTSTRLNDRLETTAIRAVFGDRRVPVTALKSQLGHSVHSAGLLQAIAAGITLRRQEIPATINLRSPDPACDLDHVAPAPRPAKIDYLLGNSFAFGGMNTCLVLRKAGSA